MPTDDQQVLVTGIAPTPASFVIPGNGQIQPKTVFASYDGSGAGSPFLPVLKVISDGGELVGIYKAEAPVAAGGSADVSWFPGVKPAAASTPAAAVGLPVAVMASDPNGVTLPGGNTQTFVSIQNGVNNAIFATTDATVYANASTTFFTGAPVFCIKILAVGTYAILNNAFTISGFTAASQVTTYWAASNGSAPSLLQQGRTAHNTPETWDQGQAGAGPHNFTHEWMTVAVGQTPAFLAVWGTPAGAAAGKVAFDMSVVQWTTNVLAQL